MEAAFIIITILLGIILILIEILFIPGTTVVGVLGFLVVGAGVYVTYSKYGTATGTYTLIASMAVSLALLIYSFRSGTWNFMSNKQVIDARVNENIKVELNIGDEGTTVSALRPMGKALFNDEPFEVSTLGRFVDSNSKIRIVELNIKNKTIIVEPVSTDSQGVIT